MQLSYTLYTPVDHSSMPSTVLGSKNISSVWHKSNQHCKATILQLKRNKFKNISSVNTRFYQCYKIPENFSYLQ